jgi:hypothetical protein
VAKQVELDFDTGALTTLTTWPRYEAECPTCGSGRERDWPVFSMYPGWMAQGDEVAATDGR